METWRWMWICFTLHASFGCYINIYAKKFLYLLQIWSPLYQWWAKICVGSVGHVYDVTESDWWAQKWQRSQTCFPDFQLSDNRATHTSLVRDVSKLDILMQKRQHSQPCFPDFQMSMFDKLDHVSIQELAWVFFYFFIPALCTARARTASVGVPFKLSLRFRRWLLDCAVMPL